jgi:hypothetical protein
VIKTSNQWLGLRCTNPNAETQEIFFKNTHTQGKMAPPKFNNSTVTNTDNSEVDEVSENKFKK